LTAGYQAYWSTNLQSDLATRDDPTKTAFAETFNYVNATRNNFRITPQGTTVAGYPNDSWWVDHSLHNVTGVTGLQTVASKVVPANVLGNYGGIRVTIRGWVMTATSGGVTVAVNFGGSTQNLAVIPAVYSGFNTIDIAITNKGATNAQALVASWCGPGGQFNNGNTTLVIDTTLDQTFTITATNTLAADQYAAYAIDGQLVTAWSVI
jgi:hypothetical protein